MKSLPHNIDAERSLLGCVFIKNDILTELIDLLDYNEFYNTNNSVLYKLLVSMYTNNQSIDLISVMNSLAAKNIDDIKLTYLSELIDAAVSITNYREYAAIIKSKADRRKLIQLGRELEKESYKEDKDINLIINSIDTKLLNVKESEIVKDIEPINELTEIGLKRIESLYKSGGGIVGLTTGYPALDKVLCGLQKQDLIIVAARPSMGKTAFALNVGSNIAREGKSIAIFSLEMSKDQIFDRIISAESFLSYEKIRHGNLADEDWSRLVNISSVLSKEKIFIDDLGSTTISRIRSLSKKIKIKHGLDLIIIDYLQLIQNHKSIGNRNNDIAEITRGLKSLAKELNVPIVCLSQLSRACESRPDKRPILSDLRESGSIEQDADVVIFLYRDEYYYPDTEEKLIAEMIISKNRNGRTGTTKLRWLGAYQKFQILH